jgi:hypothetical protein
MANQILGDGETATCCAPAAAEPVQLGGKPADGATAGCC